MGETAKDVLCFGLSVNIQYGTPSVMEEVLIDYLCNANSTKLYSLYQKECFINVSLGYNY